MGASASGDGVVFFFIATSSGTATHKLLREPGQLHRNHAVHGLRSGPAPPRAPGGGTFVGIGPLQFLSSNRPARSFAAERGSRASDYGLLVGATVECGQGESNDRNFP